MGKLFLFFLLAFLAGLLVGIKLQMFLASGKTQSGLMINGQLIKVELAKTDKEISRGLSGRDKLENNQGMLFVFEKTGNYPFWMKEMKFNLDAVFISSEKNEQGEFIKGETVVDVIENITAPKNNEEPQAFQAKADFDRVLEINAGTVGRLKIKTGDKVEYLSN